MSKQFRDECLLCVGLVVFGVMARVVLQEIPNFAPVAGLALFAGYVCRSRRLAVTVPLAIMLISDQWNGGYEWQLRVAVYGLLALPAVWGPTLRTLSQSLADRRGAWGRSLACGAIGSSALAGSVLFFVGSNVAVWATASWYPSTAAGLAECLLNGLPFFRYTLLGDLTFALGSFAAWQLCQALTQPTRRPLRSLC
ncbi:MAG: DUF6580 family putative transport protein [Pirellulales bacterium]